MTTMVPLLLALLSPPAHAADFSSSRISWSELGVEAGALDAAPRGPAQLAVGADGTVVLYDSVLREVDVIDQGQPALSFPVRSGTDLLVVDAGVVVLDGAARTLTLWSTDGAELASTRLPDLVPSGVLLGAHGDEILAVDAFGNGHPVARVVAGGFAPSALTGLRAPVDPVLWDGHAMHSGQQRVDVPGAVKASGQRVGDWLVVDAVTSDAGPVQVTRTAWHLPSGQSAALPVDGRLYAPRGDLAALPDGGLLVLVPWPDALELLEVRP